MSDRFSQLLPILGAIVAFLFAALLLVYIFRLVFGRRIRAPGARNRPRRLDVVDVFDLDKERQLVIVRRDNTEHLLMIGGPNDVLVEASINRVEGVIARTAGWPAGPGPADADLAEPLIPRPSSQAALNLPPELFEPESEPAPTRPPAPPRIEPAASEPVRPAPPPPPPRAPAAPIGSPAAPPPPPVLPATGPSSAAASPPRAPGAPSAPASPPPRPPAPPAPARPAPPPFLSRAQQRPGPAKPETERTVGGPPAPNPDGPAAPRPPAARPAPPPLRPPPGQPGPQAGSQPPFPPRPAAPRPAPPPQPPVAAPAEAIDTLEEEMARLLGRPEQE